MEKINLKSRFDSAVDEKYKKIIYDCARVADENGYKIYLIGGFVRDLILGNPVKDVDIVVKGSASEFTGLIRHFLKGVVVKAQKDLETVKIAFPCGTVIDFASTRDEFYPTPGALPVIKQIGCELKKDVLRRDFTINSLALSLIGTEMFDPVDYVGGFSDLQNRLVRILHPRSFIDDPSRIVRAFKFCARLGFDLEKETLRLREEFLDSENRNFPFERIKSELKSIFEYDRPDFYDKFVDENLFRIFPSSQPRKYFRKGIRIKSVLDKYNVPKPERWLFYTACAFGGTIPDEKLNFSAAQMQIFRDFAALSAETPDFSDRFSVYSFFRPFDKRAAVLYDIFFDSKEAELYVSDLANVKLCVSGADLKEILPPGKVYSEILTRTLKEKINKGFVTPSDEKAFAATLAKTLRNA